MSLIGGPQVNKLPWIKRVCLKEPIKVKGYDGLPHESWEVVVLEIYFPDITGKKFAKIKREFHIVPDLDCGIIFGNDIIGPENIEISVPKRKAVIGSCGNLVLPLRITPRKKIVHHIVRCAMKTTILPKASCFVPIHFPPLHSNQDFIFKPVRGNAYLPAGCYVLRSIVSNDQTSILITNVTDKAVDITKGVRVGSIESLDDASDTRYWEKVTDDVGVYFGTREDSE